MSFSERKTEAEHLLRDLFEHEDGVGEAPKLPRYEIKERLGEGATAVVYRAWDRELKRPVALKLLRESSALNEVARQRFRREAETAAALSHPNVIQVHDAGEFSGRLYIIMELVEGKPFSEVLAQRTLDERALIGLLEKASRGVAAAHEKRIVHRDLKPVNILVSQEGVPKVADFGLAHLAESPTNLTRTGATLGTPLYMSPEQVEGRSKEISARTDVYALGAILYEILARRPPHLGETLAEIYGKIAGEEPAAPRKLNPKVTKDMETIALKALEKSPGKRYSSAEAFAEDLRRALDEEPIRARPISRAERLWRKAVKYRAILIPSFGAVVVGALLGILTARKAMDRGNAVVIERLDGDVRTIEGAKKNSAQQGQILDAGQGVETGAWPSVTVLRFEDGTRVELGPDTWVRSIKANPIPRLILERGSVRAEFQRHPGQDPVAFDTPHAVASGSGGILRLFVDPDPRRGTLLAVEKGKAELRDRAGKTITLGQGQCASAALGTEMLSSPLLLKLDLGDGVTMDLVFIPPGTFTMGTTASPVQRWHADPRPPHQVTIAKGFYMGRTPVTRGQFAVFAKATGYETQSEKKGGAEGLLSADGKWGVIRGANWKDPVAFKQTDEHPVTCISWNDAVAFCEWAAKRTSRGIRLPTEAEWEYACRAGTSTKWSFGNDPSLKIDYAWTSPDAGDQTHPVGEKKPNALGLYDLHGNIRQWCWDWAASYPADAVVDPTGPARGVWRIARGGDWSECTDSFTRILSEPAGGATSNGLRVVVR